MRYNINQKKKIWIIIFAKLLKDLELLEQSEKIEKFEQLNAFKKIPKLII